jgi:hypothetical protein
LSAKSNNQDKAIFSPNNKRRFLVTSTLVLGIPLLLILMAGTFTTIRSFVSTTIEKNSFVEVPTYRDVYPKAEASARKYAPDAKLTAVIVECSAWRSIKMRTNPTPSIPQFDQIRFEFVSQKKQTTFFYDYRFFDVTRKKDDRSNGSEYRIAIGTIKNDELSLQKKYNPATAALVGQLSSSIDLREAILKWHHPYPADFFTLDRINNEPQEAIYATDQYVGEDLWSSFGGEQGDQLTGTCVFVFQKSSHKPVWLVLYSDYRDGLDDYVLGKFIIDADSGKIISKLPNTYPGIDKP